MSSSSDNKKRKSTSASAGNDADLVPIKKGKKAASENGASAKLSEGDSFGDGYAKLTLPQIREKIRKLCTRVPTVPEGGLDPSDQKNVKDWAQQLQAVIEEFNLMLCCVSAATYKWGSDRSGAADQNLGVLSSELGNAQDQISSSVTPRLTNVLAPVVDLVISKTVTTKGMKKDEDGKEHEEEIKLNHFSREQVDPEFLNLCGTILSRNAVMLRQVVLANFHKIDTVIGDYQKATEKDKSHDSRGFSY